MKKLKQLKLEFRHIYDKDKLLEYGFVKYVDFGEIEYAFPSLDNKIITIFADDSIFVRSCSDKTLSLIFNLIQDELIEVVET